MKTFALRVMTGAALIFAGVLHAENPVIVHEWGTFTSLQDEKGKSIGGINVDDEPVPSFVYGAGFVHNLAGAGGRIYSFGLPPYPMQKGWQPADQDVTMRLETPVIYFYPPKGDAPSSALPLSVHVDFHGGLLSQFYPYAETSGLPNMLNPHQDIHLADCTSGLTWTVTHFGSDQEPPQTPDKVWTTPREVSAPEIEVKAKVVDGSHWVDSAQTEHFLFYRGVGHLDSPFWFTTSIIGDPDDMVLGGNLTSVLGWMVQIRADGTCAFQQVQEDSTFFSLGASHFKTIFPVRFPARNFQQTNLAKLQASMQGALVKAGLYPDEASAMLRTWELSYFKSPGMRFFYLVPRAWVDRTLPLKITGAPVEITRVMVGRIELISDDQKATLARLAGEPYPDLMNLKEAASQAMVKQKLSPKERDAFYSGARPLTDLGITLSPSVRDYLSLGRFRDALIVHEQAEHPSENFARFIKDNDLAAR